MRRRDFIKALAGVPAFWPAVARAQQPAPPMIGFFRGGEATSSEPLLAAFLRGLGQAGFVEGQNVSIEHRWTDDRPDRLPVLARELVERKAALIVANQPAALAAKAVTSAVPIIFLTGADPVSTGLVASLSRPGGNVTGIVFTVGDLTTKRLGLLRDLVPNVRTVGVLVDPRSPAADQLLQGSEQAGRALGMRIEIVRPSTAPELDAAFATLIRARVGGVIAGGGGFFRGQMHNIIALANRHRLPATYTTRNYTEAGGLMSYGPSITDAYHRAGLYAARILRGDKPGELPVEQATKFELVLNLKTAKLLGLTVPNSMQLLADEVIE
jgi:putative ABC transport system substrate-binding protein